MTHPIIAFIHARVTEDAEMVSPRSRVTIHPDADGYQLAEQFIDGGLDHERWIVEIPPNRLMCENHMKLALLDHHHPLPNGECAVCLSDRTDYPEAWEGDEYPCETVRWLAAPYLNHPDYDETWRV